MTYPPYPLSRVARITIMCVLIAVFFIITPIVLLSTIGYTFDRERWQISSTGSLSIDIAPREAAIYVDGVAYPRQNSLFSPDRITGRPAPLPINHFTAQTHHIQASAPGYLPFETTIDVISKQTSYVRDITLIRDEPFITRPLRSVPDQAPQLSQSGQYAVYKSTTGNTSSLYIYSLTSNQERVVHQVTGSTTMQAQWSVYSDTLLIEEIASTSSNSILRLYSAADNFSLPQNFFGSYDHLQWDVAGNDRLYIAQDSQIYQLSADGTQAIVSSKPTSSLWFVDASESLWEIDQTQSRIQNNERGLTLYVEGISLIDTVIAANQHGMLFRTQSGSIGRVVFTNPTVTANVFIFQGAHDAYPDPIRRTWYISNQWDVWQLNEQFEEQTIYKTSSAITKVVPVPYYALIALGQEHRTQLFYPDYITTIDIPHPVRLQLLGVNQDQRFFVFLNENNLLVTRQY